MEDALHYTIGLIFACATGFLGRYWKRRPEKMLSFFILNDLYVAK